MSTPDPSHNTAVTEQSASPAGSNFLLHPVYTIRESRYRWLILAGITLLIGMVGAMMMITYGWNMAVPRVWLLAALFLTLVLLGRAAWEWKEAVDRAFAEPPRQSQGSASEVGDGTSA